MLLEDALLLLPNRVARLEIQAYNLKHTNQEDRDRDREAFLQLLGRTANILLDSVQMDQATEEAIHELGLKGFWGIDSVKA